MIAAAHYIPRDESLAGRVCAYFCRLPDEELSAADIGVKWHCDPKNVSTQLKTCIDAGLLKRDGSVYSAGPNIERVDLSVAGDTPATTGRRRRGQQAPAMNIEGIVFVRARPPERAGTTQERWLRKLLQMDDGDSFSVHRDHAHQLRAAATAARKQGHVIRVLYAHDDPDMVGVYCTDVKRGAH